MITYSEVLSINYGEKQWIMAGTEYSGLDWLDSSPKPTQAELDALVSSTETKIAKNICKDKAKTLIQATDWSTLADVTTGTPKLTNQADFIAYRSAIRELIVNPIANPTFPTVPTAVWA